MPEQDATEESYQSRGPWTDVYTIGRLLFYMTAQMFPPDERFKVRASDCVNVHDYLDEIIARATAKQPSKRYDSARALGYALENRNSTPEQASLVSLSDETTHTVTPGTTIGKTNVRPTTHVEVDNDFVSSIHCLCEFDREEGWKLVDKSINGTYLNKVDEPANRWHCLRSPEGVEHLRERGHDEIADETKSATH